MNAGSLLVSVHITDYAVFVLAKSKRLCGAYDPCKEKFLVNETCLEVLVRRVARASIPYRCSLGHTRC